MKILLSDTHLGCRQNSITWLNSQLDFFYNQLIPFIKQQKETVYVYHLGDVFDIRSTVSLYVANKTHKLFEDLLELCNVVVIGGNHDYYSPVESEDNVNTLRIVLGDLTGNPNFQLYDKECGLYYDGEELFVPWFRYFDYDFLKTTIENEGVKRVFVHNDLTVTFEDKYRELFKNCEVYSGHIHTPKHVGNLHTLGSTFALTFADSNSERGFYTMNNDGSNLVFHPNTKSIKFWRLYNDKIFRDVNIKKDDYVELYIDQNNLLKDSFVQRIKEISGLTNNVVTIPKSDFTISDDSTDFEKYDIADICRQNIPDNLLEKFNLIVEKQTND